MAQRIRIIFGFGSFTDKQLLATGGAVIAGMTGNKAFPNPPVELTALQTGLTQFTDAIAAQGQGGTTATADKNNKRDALVALLQKLALYVQAHSDNDLATLLSSGFTAGGGRRGSSALPKPAILSVDNGNSTQLLVKVGSIANARCYELRSATIGAGGTPGPWQTVGLFTNSRAIPVNGLTPGAVYAIQARAVGGSTSYSDWSDPVSHMCM